MYILASIKISFLFFLNIFHLFKYQLYKEDITINAIEFGPLNNIFFYSHR